MATMPSPVDLRIWLLSKVLGWPGRKVAEEVGVSQPTVVRTLERLSNDPPTDEEMKEFVSTGTPPKGIPALRGKPKVPRRVQAPQLTAAVTFAVILIALAVTLVLVSLAVAILSR